MLLKHPTIIRDALYNTTLDSGSSEEYARGVVLGCVATLMSCGLTFQDAWGKVQNYLPPDYRPAAIPPSWYFPAEIHVTLSPANNNQQGE